MPKTFFIVTCCGFSGSKWLAAALDRHPDILCTHAATDLRIWDRSYNTQELLDCADEEWFGRIKKPLDEYLGELAGLGDATVCGNVHRYRVTDLVQICEKWPPETPFHIANLVRHPVLWVESGANQYAHLGKTNIMNRYEMLQSCMMELEFYRHLEHRHRIDLLDWNVLAFLSVCMYMSALVPDVQLVNGMRHVPMESITTDAALFTEIVFGLTGGHVKITDEYVDEVMAMGQINRHRREQTKKSGRTATEQFTAWAPWQKEGFLYFAGKFGVREIYEPLDYDFSFCDAPDVQAMIAA